MQFFALLIALFGICFNISKTPQAIASFLMWVVFLSCVFQLIAICVYGGKGVADYNIYEPYWSMIVACVALCIDFIAVILFFVEVLSLRKKNF